MIFLDANIVSELMHKAPDPDVVAWLERHDADCNLIGHERPATTAAVWALGRGAKRRRAVRFRR